MARYAMHLVHKNADDRWHLQHNGRSIATFDAKAEGLAAGQARAHALQESGQDSQLIVHRKDGSIEHEYAYGHDPERFPS